MNPIDAIMDAHQQLGLPPIKEMPGGVWDATFGPWRMVVNANREPVTTPSGVTVDPYHTYVEYHGWPAGVLGPAGDGQFAAGVGANPETFAAALAEWSGPRRGPRATRTSSP